MNFILVVRLCHGYLDEKQNKLSFVEINKEFYKTNDVVDNVEDIFS